MITTSPIREKCDECRQEISAGIEHDVCDVQCEDEPTESVTVTRCLNCVELGEWYAGETGEPYASGCLFYEINEAVNSGEVDFIHPIPRWFFEAVINALEAA